MRARHRGFRWLGLFWAAIGVVAVSGIGVLALLGPPPDRAAPALRADGGAHSGRARLALARTPPPVVAVAALADGVRQPPPAPSGTALLSPDPALGIAAPDFPGRVLPQVAPDGRAPRVAYAGHAVAVLPGQARLALVVEGIGLNRTESLAAIAELPPAVAMALSPYPDGLAPIAAAARARGHELLVSLPMEPADSPDADEGDRQLSVANDDATNARDLEWTLSAFTGYAGVVGVEVGGQGEHFAPAVSVFRRTVGDELAARGLYYLAPPSQPLLPSPLPVLQADAAIEAGPAPDALDTALEQLATTALHDGTAVGVLGPPIGSTEARLVAFLRTLPARGIIVVPPSVLAAPLAIAPGSAAASTPDAVDPTRVDDASATADATGAGTTGAGGATSSP